MNYFELDEGKNQTIFAKTSLSTIKLLTYNLFLRPPGIKTNKNDYKNERLEEFFKIMGNYDIICLQEVFATFSSRKERLLKKAIKHGFYFIESSPDPSFFSFYVIDGGLVVLSKFFLLLFKKILNFLRFPIISSEFCFFKYSDFPDSLTFRGGLYNKIEVFGETLHLFTGHTQATYLGNEAGMVKKIFII